MGQYSRYENTANVFDRNRSWAGIRKDHTGTGNTANTQIVYDDVLCHNGWGVGPASDELMHYGISGMKWGFRRFQNKDGSLTPEGRERYGVPVGEVKKAIDRKTQAKQEKLANDIAKKDPKVAERIAKSKEVKKAIKDLEESTLACKKARDEFWKWEDDWYSGKNPAYDEYTLKLAKEQAKKYDKSEDPEDIKRRLHFVRIDDGDQGESLEMYLNDHPQEKKKYDAAWDKDTAAMKEHYANCKKKAAEMLGDSGNKVISTYKDYNGETKQQTVADIMTMILNRESTKNL